MTVECGPRVALKRARWLRWPIVAVLASCSPPRPFTDVVIDRFEPIDAAQTAIGIACGLDPNGEAIGGCSAGQTCLSPREGYPNGYCAGDCLRAACPEGTECYPVDATHRYCIARCSTSADCRRAEGYVCLAPRPGAPPACLPNPEPVGHRIDGTGCYATGGVDAGATGPFLSPLPAITFTERASSVSRDRIGTLEETDPSLAFDPSGLHDPLVAYAGYYIQNGVSYWRGGLSHLAADTSFLSAVVVRDHDFPDVTLVNVRYDRTGRLHLVFFAENTDRPGNPVRYASSDDGGATFTPPVYLFPQGHCLLRCENPAMAIGPADGAHEAVYATMIESLSNGTTVLQFAAAPVVSAVFSSLVDLADGEIGETARRTPRVSAIAAGPAAGYVAVTWIAQNVDNGLAALGDRQNRVRVRVSHDGGATFGAVSEVARTMDAPVGLTPAIDTGPGVLHVTYVTGGLDGAWNVVLATSRDDGATWVHRVVNDDEPCATHAWASLAVDPVTGDAHVLFLDNRFWPGEVVYSRCPADATQRCVRNELVSGEAFALSTTQDPARWLGTRSALRFAPDGTLWAAWADTRTGGPGIYVARGRPVAR